MLHDAAEPGAVESVQVLLRHGVPVDVQDEAANVPLQEAARRFHPELVRVLLAAGANRDAVNKKGRTPVDLAREQAARAKSDAEQNRAARTIQFLNE
jgi:ankyrin repeat protein